MIRKVIFFVAGVFLSASLIVMAQSITTNNEQNTYKQLARFGDIFERVRTQYVTIPDDQKLIENAINGMLLSLDPHSSYMDAEKAKDMRDSTKGEFGGLGIEVTMENNLIKVVSPIDDTPAAKAGVLAGDFISKIDGKQISGQTLNEAVDQMRGPAGTPITLTINRFGVDKPLDIKIVRDIIKVKAVKYRVEGDIGYLRLIQFTEKTFSDLQAAIKDIQSKIPTDKLKGYVLDLRLNPGGLLDQAISVTDAFLNKGEIVSTRGRKQNDVMRFDAKLGDLTDEKPIIVLINGGSASASEIVAGALQDHRRATIIGTQSFGKGSVQTIIPLGENGALRLTTALYYTPSGTSIQGIGITPDIVVEQPLPEKYKGYDVTLGESELRGHIKGKQESDKGSGSAAFVPRDPKDDVQLNEAYKLLRGEITHAAFPPDPNKVF
ncbi:carboxy-terminal-processing protease [Bartonella bacilliformis str. Heidi Mejia]|uniref:Carboxy-terminal-processing protease n=2 Tax=Bartonella bacilliformis TaxID=774 RepID=CTPA_BARBK|nr:S41 family peptidase [Bartonella bacilliformis]Q44879.1 RecName: Full=Carboxy-terminal-processing protease; Short=C-terminal-processing protease; Flags: Precursor [Bartonella bacilliformis KC583]AAB61766.1 protease [Bartonella bacilliformis]ABM45226.1 C-terminal processing peptidase [Bartonella bacilliformis KC583]AMG85493.1 carboxy-terminal-processing protease [Bartonella bacilliformis]EKS45762.1 carboxyl-terminal protease [Bartonella bacilliformis INS]EYS90220.1 carboxy-terminal-processi